MSPGELESADGSKGWGQNFRDGGKFGSHPSFDPYDDEAWPD